MERSTALLVEYSEAGQSCRAHEGYVRTTLNMHLTLSTAVAAFLVSSSLNAVAQTYACLGMAAVSLSMVFLVLRHRKIYSNFARRAREIEAELGMTLYTQTKTNTSSDEPTAKTLSAFIIGLICVAFLAAAFFIAFKS